MKDMPFKLMFDCFPWFAELVKEMPFKLTPRRASLSSEYISKAAQTAYDIASHPAAAQEATEQRHQLHEMVFAGRATFSEDDCNREGKSTVSWLWHASFGSFQTADLI